jgi:hypothetical protein
MSNVIDEARNLLQGRIDDLSDEQGKLERALAEITGNGSRPKRRPGRPRKAAGTSRAVRAAAKPRNSKGGIATRRKREGGRADQAVALITAEPGIGASKVAKKMKIKPNYLYRVLGELEKEGRVKKDGRNYSPA